MQLIEALISLQLFELEDSFESDQVDLEKVASLSCFVRIDLLKVRRRFENWQRSMVICHRFIGSWDIVR